MRMMILGYYHNLVVRIFAEVFVVSDRWKVSAQLYRMSVGDWVLVAHDLCI